MKKKKALYNYTKHLAYLLADSGEATLKRCNIKNNKNKLTTPSMTTYDRGLQSYPRRTGVAACFHFFFLVFNIK